MVLSNWDQFQALMPLIDFSVKVEDATAIIGLVQSLDARVLSCSVEIVPRQSAVGKQAVQLFFQRNKTITVLSLFA